MTRSITVPPKLSVSTRTTPTPEIGAADGIETLYVHPAASIIKFTTGGSRPSSSSGPPHPRQGESSGTLPWAYPTESTVAVGPMEIYRVPGSVSFLHSGALLHAILPRSQCWCVDGVSKFAFRVLPETYYRIELPGETADDLELVEALKATLKKVLFYERTPCPFARGFTVDIPQEEVKLKKSNSVRSGPAKKWRLAKAYSWKPEGWEENELQRQLQEGGSRSSGEERSEQSDEEEDTPSDESAEEKRAEEHNTATTPSRMRPAGLGSMRSVTAPSHLQAQPTKPSRVLSRVKAVETVDRAEKAERVRFHAEVDRRSSVRAKRLSAIPVDLPPSPPDSSAGAEMHTFEEINEQEKDVEDPTESTPETEESNDSEDMEVEAQRDGTAELETRDEESDSIPVIGESGSDASSRTEDDVAQRNLQLQTPPADSEGDIKDLTASQSETEDGIVQYDLDSLPRQLAEVSISKETEQDDAERNDQEPPTALPPPRRTTEDPYAAIQARIQARRSIGGTTTSFHPASTQPITRKSTSSNASSSTVSIASQLSTKSKPKPTLTQRHNSLTSALVNKACSVFLGPPAHLVTMMLRIAARFSSGAFGSNSMFFVESPVGSPRRVPGSFYLEDEEEQGWKSEEDEDCDEDDFGVPLKSPVRISGLRERARREGWEMT